MLYDVPKLNYNLFSVGIALDKGLEMQSTKTNCELIKDGRIVVMGVRQGKMYVMQFEVTEPKRSRSKQGLQAYITSISNDMLKDWHEKLAHQNFKHVRQILNRLQISVKGGKDPFCEACTMEKMHRLPFPDSNTKTKDIGEIIHADLCGPMPTKSFGRSRYYLLLKDDYSYYREIYFIESKAETLDRIENFLKKAEKQCPRGVRILRTDNGLEFVNNEMKALTDRLGIRHQRTVAYTPEQNGSAERDNRTSMEAGRTLMFARGFDEKFWAEAINTAVATLNRTGSIKGTTPYELWFQGKADIKDLHIFGEEVYTHIPKERRRALDAKARKGYFIGYGGETKGYRVWYLDNNRIAIVRDIIFTGKLHRAITQEKRGNDDLWLDDENNLSQDEDSDNNPEPIENNDELQLEIQEKHQIQMLQTLKHSPKTQQKK